MALSPAFLSGAASLPILPALATFIAGFFGADEPEEDFYDFLEEFFGSFGTRLVRYGVMGAGGYGVNLRGSLSIDPLHAVPTSIPELFGAPGSVVMDVYEGGKDILKGNVYRGIEKAAPRFAGGTMQAIREASTGVRTAGGVPKLLDGELMAPSTLDTALRLAQMNPAHLSEMKEKKWSEQQLVAKYQDMRAEIYEDIRSFYATPDSKRSKSAANAIYARIYKYNDRVIEAKRLKGLSPITEESIHSALKTTK
jgi:hypothetical protein